MINFQGVSKRLTDINEFETIINNILKDDILKNKCDFSIKSKLITTKDIFKIKQIEKGDKNIKVGLGLYGKVNYPVLTLTIPLQPEKFEVMIDRGYGVHFYITYFTDIIEVYIDTQEIMFIKDFDFELTQITRRR